LTAKLLPRVKRAIRQLTLVPSKGGCFEITVNGKLIYSKLDTGCFPDEEEVIKQIEAAVGANR
jgi:selenoprotein W-related protein